jgi:hypothetical protein
MLVILVNTELLDIIIYKISIISVFVWMIYSIIISSNNFVLLINHYLLKQIVYPFLSQLEANHEAIVKENEDTLNQGDLTQA